MATYINLDSIHTPSDGELVPAAWGHGARENLMALKRPASFLAFCTGNLSANTVAEVAFNLVINHTGEMFTLKNDTVTSFTVPASGYYLASLSLFMPELSDIASPLNPDAANWLALMYKDDTDDGHYLLRQSAHPNDTSRTLSGLVRLEAGTTLSFVAYQEADESVGYSGYSSLIYMGRTL